MAYYEREILVPYLHDVSSIELLYNKMVRKYNALENRRQSIMYKANQVYNQKKPTNTYAPYQGNQYVAIIFTALSILATFWLAARIGWFIYILGGLISLCFGSMAKEELDKAKKYEKQYLYELEKYNNRSKEASDLIYTAKEIEDEEKCLSDEIKHIEDLRNNIYGVNIIPSRYRNLNVACYLYDYFSTSRETDLDKILQTMLLDEINQKMDKVISSLESVIVNQRYQAAIQQEYHKEHMTALANLERNQEMHNEYLKMIDANTTVSAFFSAANYMQINEYINN